MASRRGSAASGEGVLTTKPFRKNVAFPAIVLNSTVGNPVPFAIHYRAKFSLSEVELQDGYVYRGIFPTQARQGLALTVEG
jgi:hypothetical protein